MKDQKQVLHVIQKLELLYTNFNIIFYESEELKSLLDIFYKHILLIKENEGINFSKTIYNIKFCFRFSLIFIGFACQSVYYGLQKVELPNNIIELLKCDLISR